MDPAWLDILGNLGLPIALVIYFLRRDSNRDEETKQRETRLETRITALEGTHRKELVGLVRETTDAVQQSVAVNRAVIDVNKRVHASVSALVDVIRHAPCATPRPPSDRMQAVQPQAEEQTIDPGILAAIKANPVLARMHAAGGSGGRPAVVIPQECYEPHPSNWNIPDPGEPPKTPNPDESRSRRQAEDTRRQASE